MARRVLTAVPEVDIIKSGVNRKDPYDSMRDSDGYIQMTRTKVSKNARKEVVVERIKKQEELLKKARKDAEDIVDDDDIKKISKKIKDKKKKDKKKNKKKKKNKQESYADSLLDSVPSDLAEFIKGGGNKGLKKKKKKEKKKKKQREELGIVVKEKKKRKSSSNNDKDNKKDKEKSEVAERFKEVEKITRENIKEIDSTMEIVDKRIKELTSSSERVRGKDTALANYFAAKTSLISTKQKAATDILSSRAKVYDIEMKKEARAANAASTDADILAKIFPGISMSGNMDSAIKDHISKSGKNKDGKKKKKKEKDYDAEILMKRTKELKKSGDIEFSDWDENIEWEGKYNVAIKKSWTDGEWKFIAVDDDGNVMRDVPKSMLPSKKRVQIQFDDEKDVAIDKNTNTIYKVLQVPSI